MGMILVNKIFIVQFSLVDKVYTIYVGKVTSNGSYMITNLIPLKESVIFSDEI